MLAIHRVRVREHGNESMIPIKIDMFRTWFGKDLRYYRGWIKMQKYKPNINFGELFKLLNIVEVFSNAASDFDSPYNYFNGLF